MSVKTTLPKARKPPSHWPAVSKRASKKSSHKMDSSSEAVHLWIRSTFYVQFLSFTSDPNAPITSSPFPFFGIQCLWRVIFQEGSDGGGREPVRKVLATTFASVKMLPVFWGVRSLYSRCEDTEEKNVVCGHLVTEDYLFGCHQGVSSAWMRVSRISVGIPMWSWPFLQILPSPLHCLRVTFMPIEYIDTLIGFNFIRIQHEDVNDENTQDDRILMVAMMMLMQVVGFSTETGEAIRSRVRNLEELKVAETTIINIFILIIIMTMMIFILWTTWWQPDDNAQEKMECELQRVLLMAGHLSPALRREDLRLSRSSWWWWWWVKYQTDDYDDQAAIALPRVSLEQAPSLQPCPLPLARTRVEAQWSPLLQLPPGTCCHPGDCAKWGLWWWCWKEPLMEQTMTNQTMLISDFMLDPPQTTSFATLAYKAWARHHPCHQEAQHRDQTGDQPQQVKEPRVRALWREQGGDADGVGWHHVYHDRDQQEGGLTGIQLGQWGAECDEKAFVLERTRGRGGRSLTHCLTSLTSCASLCSDRLKVKKSMLAISQ